MSGTSPPLCRAQAATGSLTEEKKLQTHTLWLAHRGRPTHNEAILQLVQLGRIISDWAWSQERPSRRREGLCQKAQSTQEPLGPRSACGLTKNKGRIHLRGSRTAGTLLFAVNEFRPRRLFACTKRMSNVVSGLRLRQAHKSGCVSQKEKKKGADCFERPLCTKKHRNWLCFGILEHSSHYYYGISRIH